MSDTDHGTPVPDQHGPSHGGAGAPGTPDHDDDHGHGDHGHGGDTLGPVDWAMWGVGVAGVIVALLVTAGLVAATGFSFSA